MEVTVGRDSQTTRFADALRAIKLGAGCDARVDVDMLRVVADGTIRFCDVDPHHLEVRSIRKPLIGDLSVMSIKVRGVEVGRECALRLENVRIHSRPKIEGRGNGRILYIDADEHSQVVQINSGHEVFLQGTYRDRRRRPQTSVPVTSLGGDGASVPIEQHAVPA